MRPVSVCVAVTSTPGSTAPLESVTTPLICAVDCAETTVQVRAERNKPANTQTLIRPTNPLIPPSVELCTYTPLLSQGINMPDESGAEAREEFEIGQILHLKSEIPKSQIGPSVVTIGPYW
jgi:hypothetical protein